MAVVERAVKGDIDELTALRVAYVDEDSGIRDDSVRISLEKDIPAYFEAHLDRDLSVYVIRDAGRIISCAFLLVVEKPMSPAFLNGKTGTVLNVYTLPEERKKGYGKAVMKALLADAQKMGISPVELKSTEAGYPLYVSLGFRDASGDYRLMKWTGK